MKKYCFIDIETTGLDPLTDVILEIGAIVTDTYLKELDTFEVCIKHRPEYLRSLCDDYVWNMHTKNGLISRCAESSIRMPEVGIELEAFLKKHNDGDRKNLVLCGNSLGSLDLPFLKTIFNDVMENAHYRHKDLSGIWMFLQEETNLSIKKPSQNNHRAIDDCRDSIQLYKNLRTAIYDIRI